MRAPFQILVILYKFVQNVPVYCVFHRADFDQWQFLSGGGEDDETPLQAAKREIREESGIDAQSLLELRSVCCIPTDIFPRKYRDNWPEDTYVIPEYTFGLECTEEIVLSQEHTECVWLPYEEACRKLRWDSNRTALYELDCRVQRMK